VSKKKHPLTPPSTFGGIADTQAKTDAAVAIADANNAAADADAGRSTVTQKTIAANAAVNQNNAAVDAANALKKNNQLEAAGIGLAVIGLLKYLPKFL